MSSEPSTQVTLDKAESLELVLETGQTLFFERKNNTVTLLPNQDTPTTDGGDKTPSQEFDNFTILERISQGGSGIVFKAKDRLDRIWAIKVLREDRLSDDACRMFLAEAKKMQSLKHPHLLEIQDYRIYEGRPFFILPLCRESFLDKIRQGPLSVREATRLMLQISKALAYLHRQGFIHRDIKPGNLLINEKGVAYLADLGLLFEAVPFAPVASTPRENKVEEQSHHCFVPGTHSYMKPEVLAGHETNANPSWDLHAFGVTFYQMLLGDTPPVCDDPVFYEGKSREEAVPPLHRQNHKIPSALDRIISRCCAKEGGYANANQLHAALKRWYYRWPRRLASSFVIISVFALMLFAIIYKPSQAGPSPTPVAQGSETGSGQTQLPTIREVLDRDGKVNLIGEKGHPTCSLKLLLNQRAVSFLNEKSEIFSIESPNEVFIELIDTLGDSAYRIEGEILLESSDHPRCRFIHGLQSVEIGPQKYAHLFKSFNYYRPFAGKGSISGLTVMMVQDVGVDHQYFTNNEVKCRHVFPEVVGPITAKFTYTINANFATLQIDDSPVLEMSAPFTQRAVKEVCREVKPNPFPDGKADIRTGPVGIMLNSGTIQLKNVVILKDK